MHRQPGPPGKRHQRHRTQQRVEPAALDVRDTAHNDQCRERQRQQQHIAAKQGQDTVGKTWTRAGLRHRWRGRGPPPAAAKRHQRQQGKKQQVGQHRLGQAQHAAHHRVLVANGLQLAHGGGTGGLPVLQQPQAMRKHNEQCQHRQPPGPTLAQQCPACRQRQQCAAQHRGKQRETVFGQHAQPQQQPQQREPRRAGLAQLAQQRPPGGGDQTGEQHRVRQIAQRFPPHGGDQQQACRRPQRRALGHQGQGRAPHQHQRQAQQHEFQARQGQHARPQQGKPPRLQPRVQRRLAAITPGERLAPQRLFGLIQFQRWRHRHARRHMGEHPEQAPRKRVHPGGPTGRRSNRQGR